MSDEKKNNLTGEEKNGDFSLDEIVREYRQERALEMRRREQQAVFPPNPYADPEPTEQSEQASDSLTEETALEREELSEPEDSPIPEEQDGEMQTEETASPEKNEERPDLEAESEEDTVPGEAHQEQREERGKVIPMPFNGENKEEKKERGTPLLQQGLQLLRRLLQLLIRWGTHRPKVLKKPEPEPDLYTAAREQREIYRRAGTACRRVMLVCIPLLYLTFAHRGFLPLPTFLQYTREPYAWLFLTILLQCVAMLFGAEVLLTGARDLGRLRPSCESLVTVACGASLLHALSVMLFPAWGGYLPYSAVAVLALFCTLWGRSAAARGRFISLRVAAVEKNPYTVTRQERLYDRHDGVVKRQDSGTEGFVSSVLQPDTAHRAMRLAAPLLLITILVLTVTSSFGRGAPERFLWCLSALSAAAASGSAALAFALPYLRMCRRLKTFGAAVGGSHAMKTLSRPAALLLQDDDVFPPGSVTLNGLKLFHGYPVERVVAYAYNLSMYSRNCIGRLFEGVVKGAVIPRLAVEEISYYEAGGVSGLVEGNRVLVGTQEFMKRSGVHLPANIAVEYAILVAVNYELAGIFAMNYAPAGSVARILPQLTDGRNFLVLATRDFNITPDLLRKKYRLDLRHLEVPSLEQRVELSDEDVLMEGEPLAVIVKEGLAPYAESVLTTRRANRVSRVNLFFSLLASALAVLTYGFLASAGAFASASPCNLVLYLLFWLIPTVLTAGFIGR